MASTCLLSLLVSALASCCHAKDKFGSHTVFLDIAQKAEFIDKLELQGRIFQQYLEEHNSLALRYGSYEGLQEHIAFTTARDKNGRTIDQTRENLDDVEFPCTFKVSVAIPDLAIKEWTVTLERKAGEPWGLDTRQAGNLGLLIESVAPRIAGIDNTPVQEWNAHNKGQALDPEDIIVGVGAKRGSVDQLREVIRHESSTSLTLIVQPSPKFWSVRGPCEYNRDHTCISSPVAKKNAHGWWALACQIHIRSFGVMVKMHEVTAGDDHLPKGDGSEQGASLVIDDRQMLTSKEVVDGLYQTVHYAKRYINWKVNSKDEAPSKFTICLDNGAARNVAMMTEFVDERDQCREGKKAEGRKTAALEKELQEAKETISELQKQLKTEL